MSDSLFLIGLVIVAYTLAGLVKGVLGMGLPTVALALLANAMTPAQAAAVLIAPSILTNLWQIFSGPYLLSVSRRLAPMLLCLCASAFLGRDLLTGGNSKQATLYLGIALIAYAVLGLSKFEFSIPRRMEIWVGPLVGLATGLIMAATGVFVVPAVPYMQAIGMEKDELIQALGLHFTVSTVALAGILWSGDAFSTQMLTLSLFAIVPAFVGMLIGQKTRRHISVQTFRLCFFLLLFVLGLQLAARAFI